MKPCRARQPIKGKSCLSCFFSGVEPFFSGVFAGLAHDAAKRPEAIITRQKKDPTDRSNPSGLLRKVAMLRQGGRSARID